MKRVGVELEMISELLNGKLSANYADDKADCSWLWGCRSRANGTRRQTFDLKVAGAICFTGVASSKSEVKRCSKSTHQQPTFCLRAH